MEIMQNLSWKCDFHTPDHQNGKLNYTLLSVLFYQIIPLCQPNYGQKRIALLWR